MKVNYGFERAQRKRAKEQKKQEKLRRREEETAKRKALKEGQAGGEPDGDSATATGDEAPAPSQPAEAGNE